MVCPPPRMSLEAPWKPWSKMPLGICSFSCSCSSCSVGEFPPHQAGLHCLLGASCKLSMSSMGLMWHFVGVHPQADGGIAADMFHETSVDPCMGVASPHAAWRLVRCPSAFDAVSALVVPPPSLSSFPIFSVIVRVIVQVWVVEAAD